MPTPSWPRPRPRAGAGCLRVHFPSSLLSDHGTGTSHRPATALERQFAAPRLLAHRPTPPSAPPAAAPPHPPPPARRAPGTPAPPRCRQPPRRPDAPPPAPLRPRRSETSPRLHRRPPPPPPDATRAGPARGEGTPSSLMISTMSITLSTTSPIRSPAGSPHWPITGRFHGGLPAPLRPPWRGWLRWFRSSFRAPLGRPLRPHTRCRPRRHPACRFEPRRRRDRHLTPAPSPLEPPDRRQTVPPHCVRSPPIVLAARPKVIRIYALVHRPLPPSCLCICPQFLRRSFRVPSQFFAHYLPARPLPAQHAPGAAPLARTLPAPSRRQTPPPTSRSRRPDRISRSGQRAGGDGLSEGRSVARNPRPPKPRSGRGAAASPAPAPPAAVTGGTVRPIGAPLHVAPSQSLSPAPSSPLPITHTLGPRPLSFAVTGDHLTGPLTGRLQASRHLPKHGQTLGPAPIVASRWPSQLLTPHPAGPSDVPSDGPRVAGPLPAPRPILADAEPHYDDPMPVPILAHRARRG